MPRPCKHNPEHMIADDADPRREYCRPSCRVAAFHKRNEARAALLERMTEALDSGADAQVIDALRREARRLLA